MNRIIKFRGKRKDNGEWVYGYYAVFNDVDTIMSDKDGYWYAVIPETVGHFTGLIDCNSKEIYEGDKVSDLITECIVEWNEREAKFNLAIIYEESVVGIRQTHKPMPLDARNITITGNTYNN